jgi:hypothetical protein
MSYVLATVQMSSDQAILESLLLQYIINQFWLSYKYI